MSKAVFPPPFFFTNNYHKLAKNIPEYQIIKIFFVIQNYNVYLWWFFFGQKQKKIWTILSSLFNLILQYPFRLIILSQKQIDNKKNLETDHSICHTNTSNQPHCNPDNCWCTYRREVPLLPKPGQGPGIYCRRSSGKGPVPRLWC